jgi:hypothetical protein
MASDARFVMALQESGVQGGQRVQRPEGLQREPKLNGRDHRLRGSAASMAQAAATRSDGSVWSAGWARVDDIRVRVGTRQVSVLPE